MSPHSLADRDKTAQPTGRSNADLRSTPPSTSDALPSDLVHSTTPSNLITQRKTSD
jgi:hypothetical protein